MKKRDGSFGVPRSSGFLQTISNLLFILVACALLGGFVWREYRAIESTASQGTPARSAREIDDWRIYTTTGHYIGHEKAPVQVVVFADFECPACRQFALGPLRAIGASLGDTVAVIFRHFPLPYHRLAYPTARAAECAGDQDRFAEFHDAIYEHQDSLGIRSFVSYANEAGVPDTLTFASCVANANPVPAIEADIADATALGLSATPSLLVGNQLVSGAVDSAGLVSLVREALKASVQ
jgi:protein-disulfide isomerase